MARKSAFSLMIAALALAGCGQAVPEYFAVRPGFACKILTPNGYERDWHESGMMNLGGAGLGGIRNQAVCIETTTYQIEEQFAQDDPRDHQDHRVLTRSGQRVAYDFYVRLIVPNDRAVWDSVLAQITAAQSPNGGDQGRVNYITVADIFERYGNQEARSFGRALATKYDSDLDMNNNRPALENELSSNLDKRLQELHAPLQLQGVAVSNIVADPTVQNARNSALTASSVREVAASYTENYVRMQQIQANERMINVLANSKNPSTIIFNASPNIAVPANQH
ncbi:MAG TPA: SPFH domain-containing protein [Rhizomicrobium sp.]|nr:SPFH domain-containing protein [Rhizomicrobium sp.]